MLNRGNGARSWAAATLIVLAACASGDAGSPTEPGPQNPGTPNAQPAAVVAAAGNGQSATVGTRLSTALTVRVTSSAGAAVANVPVIWAVSGGGGSLSATSSLTDASGSASVQWTLGMSAGEQRATATVAGLAPVTFSATAIATAAVATQLAVTRSIAGAVSGVAFATQPVIEVRDASGSRVTSATNAVTATITSGSGSLGGTTTVNAVAGVATFTNLVINGTGAHTVTFSSAGLSSTSSAPLTVAAPPTSSATGSLAFNYSGARSGAFSASGTPVFNASGFLYGTYAGAIKSQQRPNEYTIMGSIAKGGTTADAFMITIGGLTAPGSYPICLFSCGATQPATAATLATVMFNGNWASTGLQSGDPSSTFLMNTGTITITSITATRITGTFTGNGVLAATLSGSLAFMGGTFDVPIINP